MTIIISKSGKNVKVVEISIIDLISSPLKIKHNKNMHNYIMHKNIMAYYVRQ